MALDTIPMKSDHMHADGNDTLISGTVQFNRDLSAEQNWWKLRPNPMREIPPLPVDENGVPFVLCSTGHYRSRRAFDKDTSRKTGLRAYCKQCRHEQYLRISAEAAEHASKPLHRYHDRKEARRVG